MESQAAIGPKVFLLPRGFGATDVREREGRPNATRERAPPRHRPDGRPMHATPVQPRGERQGLDLALVILHVDARVLPDDVVNDVCKVFRVTELPFTRR